MAENDMTLVYGFLIGMGLFVLVWFLFVAPSERRDHERRLELVQKRLAELEQRRRTDNDEVDDDSSNENERNRAGDGR